MRNSKMIAVNDFSIKWVRASSQTILLDVAMITKKAACLRGLFGIVTAIHCFLV
ncbi:hypothetical protein Lpp221_10827 [Lacticaseibacillus paracasei subsp. paracasei Lpp221]|uniref:Uncharacterized protein n=1 Tax=Lacticaseibacillus paracasei subsp. paracasei Lpp126 TaxID=1256206 RepID=S2S5F4_LACPA|nr:hypothetical protein Lpp221_10827 [Lacticaseibacillus paracasei subsp. paracasei Lpp221]EPC84950.1 hypothetical protein Lpp126_03227 [Lacticaseibacillus paracasei subsp. paracasei Lpp126]RUS39019.1 hypothetical protein IJ11_0008950 [Lacticaseibacillus paracasei]